MQMKEGQRLGEQNAQEKFSLLNIEAYKKDESDKREVWNSLSQDMGMATSIGGFKRELNIVMEMRPISGY